MIRKVFFSHVNLHLVDRQMKRIASKHTNATRM